MCGASVDPADHRPAQSGAPHRAFASTSSGDLKCVWHANLVGQFVSPVAVVDSVVLRPENKNRSNIPPMALLIESYFSVRSVLKRSIDWLRSLFDRLLQHNRKIKMFHKSFLYPAGKTIKLPNICFTHSTMSTWLIISEKTVEPVQRLLTIPFETDRSLPLIVSRRQSWTQSTRNEDFAYSRSRWNCFRQHLNKIRK